MTDRVFGRDYAEAYDQLYQDKDYAAECDLLERVFAEHGDGAVRRVLDLGCGTGAHAALLADRGYAVVGVDRSAAMLLHAQQRNSSARFVHGDLTSVDLGQTFDAVVSLFAVLGYLTANTQLAAALANARRHLRTGGLLFGDVWYGPAVLRQRPAERIKVIDTPGGGQVIRVTSSCLQTRRDVCVVDYHLWRLEGGQLAAEAREQHAMRYFFEPELEAFLGAARFELRHVGAFPNLDEPPSEQTWNVGFVARAR